jgi:hypothetical protein
MMAGAANARPLSEISLRDEGNLGMAIQRPGPKDSSLGVCGQPRFKHELEVNSDKTRALYRLRTRTQDHIMIIERGLARGN